MILVEPARVILELRCLHCGHVWFPKRPQKPRLCSRCRNRWDRAPIYKKQVDRGRKVHA